MRITYGEILYILRETVKICHLSVRAFFGVFNLYISLYILIPFGFVCILVGS